MMHFRDLREEVFAANIQLHAAGLVVMHSGNASGVDRESGLVLIKPSGVDYGAMHPTDLVCVGLDGKTVPREQVPDEVYSPLKPSVDMIHHLALYRKDESIGGVVHTHSNYATAWSTTAKPLPCVLTAIADEFGGDIPCIPYIDNHEDHIAQAILEYRERAPAVLLAHHGLFAFDSSPRLALKAAVMAEDVAKTVILAHGLHDPQRLPEEEIEKWWTRYHNEYGQGR